MASLTAQKPETQGGQNVDLARKIKLFRAWEDNKVTELQEQRTARRYYNTKQWTDDERKALEKRKQPIITSNRIKRKVDFLVGTEQRLRRDPKAYPRTPKHKEHSDLATDAIRFVCDNNQWPDVASDAAHDGLVSGVGVAFVGVKISRGQREITIKHVSATDFFYDPRSLKPDFSDAQYSGIHKWVDIGDVESVFDVRIDRDAVRETERGSSQLMTERDDDTEPLWADLDQDRIRVVEMYYRRGGIWRVTHFTGSMEFRDEVSQYLDDEGRPENPYKAWSPYVDEEGIHYGVVRDMKSPQDEINFRRSKLLHLMSVRQVIRDKSAVDDEVNVRTELARPDGDIKLNNPGARFEIVDPSFQAQGQAELLAESKAEIENLGPNPGLIGRGVERQSGRAILAQQNSGMTELSPVFERLRSWKLRIYRCVWTRVRQYWDAPRWIRVTDKEGEADFIAINEIVHDGLGNLSVNNPIAELDVDIILDEGPDTITIQEEEFEQLANMASSGVPIPPDILIMASNLRNKEQLLERMLGNPEEQAKQKAKADAIAEEDAVSQIEERKSKTMLNMAKAETEAAEAEKTEAEAIATAVDAGFRAG